MNSNTETEEAQMQTLTNGAKVSVGGKTYTVDIPADYPDQLWLNGVRGAKIFLRGFTNREGLFELVSWGNASGKPVVNKALQPLKVIVMGNLLQDVTGKKITL